MSSRSWFMVALGTILLTTPIVAGAEDRLPPDSPVGVIDDTGGLPHVEEHNGISYISGGAGSDEAEALNQVRDGFNLKLTASIPSGQFTSPSVIRIEDARGAKVLEVHPNGPIFLAKLPAGEYVVKATAEGATMERKVSVPASGLESIAMTWPSGRAPVRSGDAPE